MAKRYAYWRSSDGHRHDEQEGRHAPRELLKRLGESATMDKAGGLALPFPDEFRDDCVLPARLLVLDQDGEELTLDDTRDIVISGLKGFLTNKRGDTVLTPKEFLAYADKEASVFCRRPFERYTLCTRLSVKSLPQGAFKVRDCTVQSKARLQRFIQPKSLSQVPAECTRQHPEHSVQLTYSAVFGLSKRQAELSH